jgi:hypothetical protein
MSLQAPKAIEPKSSGMVVAILVFSSLNFSCSDSKNDKKNSPGPTNVPVLEPNPVPTATPDLPVTTTTTIPPQTTPASAGRLDYSGFRVSSFASIPWESKCDGIQSFMEDFTKNYLEAGMELKFKTVLCDSSFTSDDLGFWVQIEMKKDEEVLGLQLRVKALLNWKTKQLEVKETGIWRVDGVSTSFYQYQSKDNKFGRKLRLLPMTLAAWASEKVEREADVFGMPYSAYADLFAQKYGPETGGARALTAEIKQITIQLIPKEDESGQGSVKFLDVDPDFFVDYNGKNNPHLGCETLECLNAASIQYQLLGKKLVLSAQPKKKENCKVETEYFFYTVEKSPNSGFILKNGLWGMRGTVSVTCENS